MAIDKTQALKNYSATRKELLSTLSLLRAQREHSKENNDMATARLAHNEMKPIKAAIKECDEIVRNSISPNGSRA